MPAVPMPHPVFHPLAHAARLALLGMALAAGAGQAAEPAPASVPAPAPAAQTYQIAPGPLGRTLAGVATAAGISLSFDPALTEGLTSPALSGHYAPQQALQRLLAGSGLDMVARSDGSYTLRRQAAPAGAGAGSTTVLNEVQVTARAERSATSEGTGSYVARAVTVGKGEQAIKDIPQSISVITRQRMDDQNLHTVDDVLASTTGITMYDSPMGGRYVYSRGFRVDTYQFDGVNRAFYYPQADNFTSNAATLDRVEVVRGATGLLQGAGSPSAAINMVRKRPLAERQLEVSASAGSWNNLRSEIDATGPLNEAGTLRGRVVASLNSRDYFYDVASSRTGVLYGVLEYDLSSQTRLTVGATHERLRSTPFFQGLPRYADGADLRLPRSTFLGADWNRWDSEQTSLFAELQHRFNADWTVKATAGYTREKHDMKYAFALGAINPATLAGNEMYAGLFDVTTDNKTLDVAVDGKFDAFGRRHSLSFGANTGRMVNDSDYSLIRMGLPNNVFDPSAAIREPSRAEFLANRYRGDESRTRMTQSGAYGVARLGLTDALTLIGGARVTRFTGSSNYRNTGEAYNDPYKESGVITPYGGLVYALNDQWSAYASYSDIFQAQNAVTAAGDLLAPIKGRNLEVGMKGELLDGRVNAAVALFRIDQKNRAEEDLVNPCSASTYCYVSVGKVRSQGLDAEISGEVARGWQLFAGYTFSHFKYLDNTSNAGVEFASTYTPKHMLRVWSDYRLPGEWSAWNVGGGVNFQTASSRAVGAITDVQPAYAVWSARLGYRIDRNWSVALSVANLFDKTYYQTIGAPAWGNVYGAPRSATLTLRGKF
ncbi:MULTISPECIES: TonB-dependent siderophore receptor [Delftia]|uniref:TonB-dependent siderophore receptor n=2 Tax=Delftia TaxID=80865 RepID=A0A7T2YVM0_9BURK|nr:MULTISPECIES: TonB-dependent receptor [Delftia]EPD41280.1 iron complex outermembrane recepter protein [Delftia acidovorans CCUG 15835]QPS82884.1 TonB-dependent siderophore receptor [Delftia lacustris]